jgi:hypothetical protein
MFGQVVARDRFCFISLLATTSIHVNAEENARDVPRRFRSGTERTNLNRSVRVAAYSELGEEFKRVVKGWLSTVEKLNAESQLPRLITIEESQRLLPNFWPLRASDAKVSIHTLV